MIKMDNKLLFIYKLKPVNTECFNNPTPKVNTVLQEHDNYLNFLKQNGQLKWCIATHGKEFEIICFEAVGEPEAFNIMNLDPSVKKGLTTGTLYPVNYLVQS
jgi:uncharacterized protein YciI